MWLSQVDNYGDDYVIMMMVVVIVVTSSRLSGWTPGLSEICLKGLIPKQSIFVGITAPYQIIVADAADAVSVNFSGRCKFLQI